MAEKRIGILTGGGDAPGLNTVIRAVVKRAVGQLGWTVIGCEDSFNGLLETPPRVRDLTLASASGLLQKGGTILGTTNHGDPFHFRAHGEKAARDRAAELAQHVLDLGLDGLVVVGGEGTQKIAHRLMQDQGVRVVGVPKTIDNDLGATDLTFGFMSAVACASDALDRLHTTAEAHDRVMILEVMGRDAGWIALYAGLAGGADGIAIPEIPYDPEVFCEKIRQRGREGKTFTLIAVAEGARRADCAPVDSSSAVKAGGAGVELANEIASRLDVEIRVTVLGHLQRGGSPIPFDRILATRFGVKAVELVEAGRWGEMVCLEGTHVASIPMTEAIGNPRTVHTEHELLGVARSIGVTFGERR
jgi:ATP-dependent phosphofructokinase / diphosphate-dependent phosphofructokinase